MLSSAYHSHM